MNNLIRYYEGSIALDTTPQVVIDHPTEVFNVVRFKNDLTVTVIANFSENDTSGGADFPVLAGEDFMQPLQCTGRVSLRLAAGSETGDFFIRLTKG